MCFNNTAYRQFRKNLHFVSFFHNICVNNSSSMQFPYPLCIRSILQNLAIHFFKHLHSLLHCHQCQPDQSPMCFRYFLLHTEILLVVFFSQQYSFSLKYIMLISYHNHMYDMVRQEHAYFCLQIDVTPQLISIMICRFRQQKNNCDTNHWKSQSFCFFTP